jgi:hypothetical protein
MFGLECRVAPLPLRGIRFGAVADVSPERIGRSGNSAELKAF